MKDVERPLGRAYEYFRQARCETMDSRLPEPPQEEHLDDGKPKITEAH